MLTRSGFSRRQLLRTASSAILYYPLIRALAASEASAQTAGVAQRAIFVHFPSGTYKDRFWPKGDSTTIGTLPIVTSPLDAHKADMILFKGYNLVGATNHNGSMPQVLAGWGACKQGNGIECGTNPSFPSNDNTTTKNMEAFPYSVDQRIAALIGKDSKRASINLGVMTGHSGNPFTEPVSWSSTGKRNKPNDNPKAAYDDLFAGLVVATGGTTAQATAQTMIATGKKRIVDFLVGDIKRVKAGLGAHEAAAFESHLEALDAINIELDKAMATGGNAPPTSAAAICSYKSIEGLFPANLGNTGNRAWYYQGANAPAIYRIQRAIMVQAMACGITRVGVWGMGCSHQESHIPAEGVIDDPNQVHHLQAHSDSESFASNQQGQMREIARMVSDMKAIDVGGKTLFDDTLVYAATDIGDNAAAHGGNNIGAFILGNLGGKLKGGRIVDGKGAPYNHLLVTMGQLMGLKDETIGNTAAKGPVSGIIS